MRTRQQLLDMLADERDRISDESIGLSLAFSAGCSPAALAVLLVPGIGAVVFAAARAACAVMSLTEMEDRIDRLDGLVLQIENLASSIEGAPEDRLPALETAVIAIVRQLATVDATSEIADDAIELANGLVRDAREILPAVPALAALAAVAVVVVGGLIFFR